jgi:peptide methionine sulfoxide reductase MsrA
MTPAHRFNVARSRHQRYRSRNPNRSIVSGAEADFLEPSKEPIDAACS